MKISHLYAENFPQLTAPFRPIWGPKASILLVDDKLAAQLNLSPDEILAALQSDDVAEKTVAMLYAGHQFGQFNPRMGDGRAALLGEVSGQNGMMFDLHLKGSGATPYARGGDGKAGLGPVLREFLMARAMAALDVPTTGSLAVIETGEQIWRDVPQPGPVPGAILVRSAASHLRVGHVQYIATMGDDALLSRFIEYVLNRHNMRADAHENMALSLLQNVMERQAALIAKWMSIGFVHGVMNTDNMTLSGETIDYGPCAFLDEYNPASVFSSIDRRGRYAYGQQPAIGGWNLARLAEAMLSIIDDNVETAIEKAQSVLSGYTALYDAAWRDLFAQKIGLFEVHKDDGDLIKELLTLLAKHRVDFTQFFAELGPIFLGEKKRDADNFAAGHFGMDLAVWYEWKNAWQSRRDLESMDEIRILDVMRRANPLRIARNHHVEAAINAYIYKGDDGPFKALYAALSNPFEQREEWDIFDAPPQMNSPPFQSFCGT
ncbi:protein adenylyltransferase SelO [Sphingorhabdus lutea]|uniref:protein adenylyltransferase SelO n=1 Tax=Sphingorhabdus lutea TaxID=1913578 RepID=UPI000AA4805B|nr:YdiU family protein [Sphingorhabdus lutea]